MISISSHYVEIGVKLPGYVYCMIVPYNWLFMRPRKLCILAKKGNFKSMWIIFMHDSTCGVAMLRRYKLCE